MNEDSVIVIDRQEERKKRGALAVILAIAFIALLGIGSTFAYLTWTANQTPNRETMGELTADLIEPTYTNAAITDNGGTIDTKGATSGITVASAQYYASDGKLIPQNAANMIPSSEYAKNPFVVNTSKAADAYGFAGLKVQFQKWNKTTDGDKGGTWVDMTDTDVSKLLAVYSISSNPNSTTAGFIIDHAAYKWANNKVNTTTANVNSGDAGTTANKWIQMTGKSNDNNTDYGATAAGTANSTGAMYFVNFGRLVSIENAKASDQVSTSVSSPNFTTETTETRLAVTKNTSTNALSLTETSSTPTWGYQADDLTDTVKFTADSGDAKTGKFEKNENYDPSSTDVKEISSSTSPLFQYVRYLDNSSQTDIDALMNVLDPVAVTLNTGNTFTPGWRMVISAAIIQSTSAADVTGKATGKTDVAQPLIKAIDESSGAVTLNNASTWFTQFKGVLDNVGEGTVSSSDTSKNVDRTKGQKPQAATGFRETSTFGEWWTTDGTDVTHYKGDGVPESTNIGIKAGDSSSTANTQIGSEDATTSS